MTDIYGHLSEAQELLDMAIENQRHGDHMSVLRTLDGALKRMQEAAIATVQKAYDGGASKKAIAQALDIPASTLRGLKKTDGSRGPKALEELLRLDQ